MQLLGPFAGPHTAWANIISQSNEEEVDVAMWSGSAWLPLQATAEETPSEKMARRALNYARRQANHEMHSLRSGFELKLQVSHIFVRLEHLCRGLALARLSM